MTFLERFYLGELRQWQVRCRKLIAVVWILYVLLIISNGFWIWWVWS